MRAEPQTGVLAHGVLGDVVEPPVRRRHGALPFGDRVTELVKDQLRERVVGVERVVGADGDRAAPVAGGVRLACARDRKSDRAGGLAPDRIDRGAASAGASFAGADAERSEGGVGDRYMTGIVNCTACARELYNARIARKSQIRRHFRVDYL